ncbi:MAG: hypothetical protein ACE5RH_00560 [Nitrosarchaeum sp.]
MSHSTNEFNYLAAYNILCGLKPVSTIESSTEDDSNEIILSSTSPDAEKRLMKIGAFESLSEEAKEIINIIINAPPEFFNLITTPKRSLISKRMLKTLFVDLWYSEFIVEETLREIEQWIKTL